MNHETMIAMLAELERIRELTVDLIEAQTPRLIPPAPEDDGQRAIFDVLLGARRAVLGNPAAARRVHDMLVDQGRRYARTPQGAQLRDALATSEAVENLRRIWEMLSLNVLDGPCAPDGRPDAWADLVADVALGQGVDDALLDRLRPEGFA